MIETPLAVGQMVKSKAGRDKGRTFLICRVEDDQYVWLVDGKLRKMDRPKKKKRKHLVALKACAAELQQKLERNQTIEDYEVRRALEALQLSEEE